MQESKLETMRAVGLPYFKGEKRGLLDG